MRLPTNYFKTCDPRGSTRADSAVEEARFEPLWGFFCQVVFLVCGQFFVRSGKVLLRPVA